MTPIKHQLLVHLDYWPATGDLEMRFSYPPSSPHPLGEQVVRLAASNVPVKVKAELEILVPALAGRIPTPGSVRLPHAVLPRRVRLGAATIVIQNQQRSGQLPIARLYYSAVA